jgi:hypothetical protein
MPMKIAGWFLLVPSFVGVLLGTLGMLDEDRSTFLVLLAASLVMGTVGGFLMVTGTRLGKVEDAAGARAITAVNFGGEFRSLGGRTLEEFRRLPEGARPEILARLVDRALRGRYSGVLHSAGLVCSECGAGAPTRWFEFNENIGMFFARTSRSLEGHLCRDCMSKTFLVYTARTLFLGWWGMISFAMTLVFLPANVAWYLGGIGLPGPRAGEGPLTFGSEDARALGPHVEAMVADLGEGTGLAEVARVHGDRAGVPPARAVVYLVVLARGIRASAGNDDDEMDMAEPG